MYSLAASSTALVRPTAPTSALREGGRVAVKTGRAPARLTVMKLQQQGPIASAARDGERVQPW